MLPLSRYGGRAARIAIEEHGPRSWCVKRLQYPSAAAAVCLIERTCSRRLGRHFLELREIDVVISRVRNKPRPVLLPPARPLQGCLLVQLALHLLLARQAV